jgi:tagaturonate reductase
MNLSKKAITEISGADIPGENYFQLPEKVLQFGTGVLLRGLPDYFIDKANKQHIFNGRVVIVKSTDSSGSDAFKQQDGLYTHCIRGIENGKKIEKNIINASVSRIISAKNNWEDVLQCAANPDMQLIISNTTEVGITLTEDNVHACPPISFPGKLLAFLYKRFIVFNGDVSKGLVIVPTELIPDNADKLLSILVELSNQNKLEKIFSDWLQQANYFCNSLVDRIVPGKLPAAQSAAMERALGYTDELMIMSEPYSLWAIESGNDNVKKILSFSKTDSGVVIARDINIFRELKLRLLNGSHTFSCGLALLAGFTTVKEAMGDESFTSYIKQLMLEEITPSITGDEISIEEATVFSGSVLDRFSNPFLEHQWLAITVQYSSKMCMRNVPVIINYIKRFNAVPQLMALGFAAHILFLKPAESGNGKYYGEINGKKYLINDDNAAYYYDAWKNKDAGTAAQKIMDNNELWKTGLQAFPAFAQAVINNLYLLMNNEAGNIIRTFINKDLEKENA